jgi:hypothetical protein
MSTRTKVFVSYSHEDCVWLDRLSQHLAILERRGLVSLWSDRQIDVGSDWRTEIDHALTAAKVAVLLVSPAFLASKFIWDEEIPRILAHSRQGMDTLPLVVRPCAWRLEEELAKLQARPTDGRPLSLGSDSQVDADLTAFTYELAAKIGRSTVSVPEAALIPSPISRDELRVVPGVWNGHYNGTRAVRLRIREVSGDVFTGMMEYPNEGTVTKVEGTVAERWSSDDPVWAQLDGSPARTDRLAIVFHETGYEKQGTSSVSFDGEYRLFLNERNMTGAWFSGNRLVGALSLERFVAQPSELV